VTFAQLRSFATVARTGSLTTAAAALGVSEPAVSSAIAALRRDLGDSLFVRAGSGIRLTPGGERLAAAAAEILGLEDRLRREVGEARGERGLLRLAVSAPVAEYVSAPLLDAFTRRWPTLEVA
jgi:LysR family transcriptional regulator, low CO2-responsive transcriptional regulator